MCYLPDGKKAPKLLRDSAASYIGGLGKIEMASRLSFRHSKFTSRIFTMKIRARLEVIS